MISISRKRKGISPLIAVIVLIALTMIVAGIIATFTQTFTQRTFEEVTTCSTAGAIISGATYTPDPVGGLGELTVVIRNTGSLDLDFVTNIVFSDLQTDEDLDIERNPDNPVPVPVGDLTSVLFGATTKDVPANINRITITSVQCQGVIQDFLAANFIVGLGGL